MTKGTPPQSKARGSQSTMTQSRGGQNKPDPGGKAGAGDARGTARLPNISKTTSNAARRT